ncbi:RNA polymerase II mediator complex subunit [Savitreella phatthalungensis]
MSTPSNVDTGYGNEAANVPDYSTLAEREGGDREGAFVSSTSPRIPQGISDEDEENTPSRTHLTSDAANAAASLADQSGRPDMLRAPSSYAGRAPTSGDYEHVDLDELDVCTKLQSHLDAFGTQMYSCLHYLNTRHDLKSFPQQPKAVLTDRDPLHPASQAEFNQSLTELARDLTSQVKLIEALALNLPGRGRSQEDQEAELRELQKELAQLASAKKQAVARRDDVCDQLQKTIIAYGAQLR